MQLSDEAALLGGIDVCARQQPKVVTGPATPLRIIRAAPTLGPPAITTLPIGLAPPLAGALQGPITLTGDGILEVIPQNFQPAHPQAILLTTPGGSQSAIPIATLPQGQIIIQTLPVVTEALQENLLVQMQLSQPPPPTELVVNASLAPPPPSPPPVEQEDSLGASDSSYTMCCIDGEEFRVEEIHNSSTIDEVDDSSLVSSQMGEHRAESVILSDPMLAGSPEMLGSVSDIDSDKSHVADDGLDDGVSEDT